jgi:cell division protein FtsB
MMSDMGRERIGVYVQSMMHHNEVLAEMVNIGIISDRVLAAEVESISSESEKTEADLAMIRNALVRFIHTDNEKIKSSRIPRGPSEKNRSPENELVAPDLPVPSLRVSQNTALTVDDTLGY